MAEVKRRAVKIPQEQVLALKFVLAQSEEEFGALTSKLREIPARYTPPHLAAAIARKLGNTVESRALATTLLTILTAADEEEMQLETLLSRLIDSISSSPEFSDLTASHKELLRDRLIGLGQSSDAFAVALKSGGVIYDQERAYLESRILTDMRPIFSETPDETPNMVAITHELKFVFREDFQNREFFIVLDDSDLNQLSKVIERAIKKANTLRKSFGGTVPFANQS